MPGRVLAFGAIVLAATGALLFGIAGRLDWPGAWALLVLLAAFLVVVAFRAGRRDPDLMRERLTSGGGRSPRADKILLAIYRPLLIVMLLTAAFDTGRYRWSATSLPLQTVGAGGILLGFIMTLWCMDTNRFLSSVVRVQSDRGHRLVQDGPYRYVRHPMYAGLIALIFGIPLLLGSWLALAPALLAATLLIIRIAVEERVLRDGLDGYEEYRRRVPYRLLPGIW